jgi:hypothetical protein
MKTLVNERVMNFFDFISEGFKIFLSRIGDFSILALINIIPASFFILFIQNSISSKNTFDGVQYILLFAILVVYVIIGLITGMSSKIIVAGIVENKTVSLKKAIELASSKWGRAFTTQLLTSLVVFAWSLLFFIPGFIYSIYYLFVLDAVALRDKSGQEALQYSKSLVEGQWWRVFGITVGVGILFGIFNGLISFVIGKISDNPYFVIIPNAINLYVSSNLGIISTVLFLNNDFVYHRRLTRRIEAEQRKEYSPTIDKYLKAKKNKKASAGKDSTGKKVKPKAEKPKTPVKRSTRKKD